EDVPVLPDFFHHVIDVPGFFTITFKQVLIKGGKLSHALDESIFIPQAQHVDAVTGDLVCVGATDAAAGSADFVGSASGFHHVVQLAVVGHDHVGVFTDEKTTVPVHTRFFNFFDFLNEGCRINDDAVADNTGNAVV